MCGYSVYITHSLKVTNCILISLPNFQFTSWVDAVIFVFSLENEASFSAIYNYYVKMSQFRNMQEIPLILVGTQGKLIILASAGKCHHLSIPFFSLV